MKQKFRFHVISIPVTRTTKDYSICPFTQKCRLFCEMMYARGHYIMHYGVEGGDPDCDENIAVVSNEEYEKDYYMNNPGNRPTVLNEDIRTDAYKLFIKRTIEEIKKRIQPQDIILTFWGYYHKDIGLAFDCNYVVEPGIGYMGTFAPYRIYESNAMMTMDAMNKGIAMQPNFYHVVIPPFFDTKNVKPNLEKRTGKPYFFFVGRIGTHKGLNIAEEVCDLLGVDLKIAGPMMEGSEWLVKDRDWLGPVSIEQRNELMRNAVGVFMPTTYMEPFGYVQVESMLCGTPVITTDWGSFPEVNEDGISGYRCRTFNDFVQAALNCLEGKIDYKKCREHGEHYSFDAIAPLYEKYFRDLLCLSTEKGWYTIYPEIQERLDNIKEKL